MLRIIKEWLIVSIIIALGLVTLSCQQSAKQGSSETAPVRSKYYSAEKVTPKERKAEVSFKVDIAAFSGSKKVRLWIPYPVSNEHQDITNVKVSGNFNYSGVYSDGKSGNTMLYAEWVNPQAMPDLNFTFDVKRNEIIRKNFPDKSSNVPSPEAKEFLVSTSLGPTNGAVRDVAKKVTKGKTSILAKSEAIYDYLIENYQRDDSIKGCGKGDVCQLLSSKKGKCADIHSVYVAMAKSVGVPAKEIFGIRIPKEPAGDMTKAYHCVAEFYDPGYGWVPVDASDVLKLMLKENLKLNDPKVEAARTYFFGAQNANYIEFGTGRDLTLNPPQEAGKLNYFMYPYAEVDGKALDYLSQQDLKYTVTYKEL